MGVEIRPFKNREGKVYESVVFVDGECLPRQTVEGPWIEGNVVKVSCITDKRVMGTINPETVPYQVKPFEVSKGISKACDPDLEITILYLKLD